MCTLKMGTFRNIFSVHIFFIHPIPFRKIQHPYCIPLFAVFDLEFYHFFKEREDFTQTGNSNLHFSNTFTRPGLRGKWRGGQYWQFSFPHGTERMRTLLLVAGSRLLFLLAVFVRTAGLVVLSFFLYARTALATDLCLSARHSFGAVSRFFAFRTFLRSRWYRRRLPDILGRWRFRDGRASMGQHGIWHSVTHCLQTDTY